MSQVPTPTDPPRPRPLWRNLNFQLMWTSVAASGFGDRMIETAALPLLGVLAAEAVASDKIAAIYFWYFLPWIFITPLAGWLADTLPRKWILLTCDESRAVVLLTAALMVPTGIASRSPNAYLFSQAPQWKIFLILALVGGLACIFSITRNAMIPQLVPSRQLNSANAIVLGIGVIASLLGNLGALVVQNVSVRRGIELSFAAFAVSGLFFIFMQPRPHTGLDTDRYLGQWRRFTNAVGYIRRHRPIRDLVLLNVLVWSLSMIVLPTIGSLCIVNYALPRGDLPWGIAKISMALGCGMMASALVVSWLNVRREAPLIMLTGLLPIVPCLVALGLNRSYTLGLGIAFLIGFFGGVSMISVASLTQALCPNYILGRVTGAREVISNIVAVSINFLIWQLPGLRAVDRRVPEADPLLIKLLFPLAAVLGLAALWGLWFRSARGPLPAPLGNILWRICRLYTTVWHRLHWIGAAHVPHEGPVILAANHTTGLDPFLLQSPVPRTVTWVMLKEYQFRVLWFLWRQIRPIGLERGGHELVGVREVIQHLKAGEIVGLFPEGGLQRTHRELQPLEPGIGLIAVRSGALIVPVWIDGTPRKQNMLWHFLCPSRATVIYGRAYKPDPALSYAQIADDLRQRLLQLSEQVPTR